MPSLAHVCLCTESSKDFFLFRTARLHRDSSKTFFRQTKTASWPRKTQSSYREILVSRIIGCIYVIEWMIQGVCMCMGLYLRILIKIIMLYLHKYNERQYRHWYRRERRAALSGWLVGGTKSKVGHSHKRYQRSRPRVVVFREPDEKEHAQKKTPSHAFLFSLTLRLGLQSS